MQLLFFIFQVVIKYVLITKDEKYYICDFFAKYNCVFFEGFWNHIIMGFLKFMSPNPHFPQIPQPLQSWVFYVLVYLLYFSVSEKNNTSQKLVCRFTIAYIKIKKIVSFASYFPQIHLGRRGPELRHILHFEETLF